MIRESCSTGYSNVAASTPSPELGGVRRLHHVDLARRWRISPRTLERWRVEGRGPAYLKIGGRVVYRLEDIEAYEAAQLHFPGHEPRHQGSGV